MKTPRFLTSIGSFCSSPVKPLTRLARLARPWMARRGGGSGSGKIVQNSMDTEAMVLSMLLEVSKVYSLASLSKIGNTVLAGDGLLRPETWRSLGLDLWWVVSLFGWMSPDFLCFSQSNLHFGSLCLVNFSVFPELSSEFLGSYRQFHCHQAWWWWNKSSHGEAGYSCNHQKNISGDGPQKSQYFWRFFSTFFQVKHFNFRRCLVFRCRVDRVGWAHLVGCGPCRAKDGWFSLQRVALVMWNPRMCWFSFRLRRIFHEFGVGRQFIALKTSNRQGLSMLKNIPLYKYIYINIYKYIYINIYIYI